MNAYFYELAKRSAEIAGEPIKAEWIYSQWAHETGEFTSELCMQYHNLGGLCQTTPNDLPQPDGDLWYMEFDSFEAYAEYFGRYLRLYDENGIYNSQNLADYVVALKNGGYFGDSLENYLAGTHAVYAAEFGGTD